MATHRHTREPRSRRFAALIGTRAIRLAVGAAASATVAVVGLGVLAAHPAATELVGSHAPAGSPQSTPQSTGASTGSPAGSSLRRAPVSRTLDRSGLRSPAGAAHRATALAIADADTRRWTTVDLDLWTSAAAGARKVGEIASGHRVLLTGRSAGHRVELVVHGRSRWVTAGYLSDRAPAASVLTSAGLSMAPCPDPSVEYRLTSGAIYVYRSVCHAFPQITTYGGWDDHGEHVTGKALDIMTSDVALGNAIAAFLQQHAAELHIYDILWRQHIWTPVRSAEGWRLFADRGSPTANHMNHVHVSVY